MSSLQPALVYKYTVTFTAEPAGLPWVWAGEGGGGLVSHSCVGQALLLGLYCCKSTFQLCTFLCQEGMSLSPSAAPRRCPTGDAPLEMTRWRCSCNVFPTRFMWILGAIPLRCWVESSSRSKSPVGALQQPEYIQRPTGSSSCQPTYHDDSQSKHLNSLVLLTAIHSYPSKKPHFT